MNDPWNGVCKPVSGLATRRRVLRTVGGAIAAVGSISGSGSASTGGGEEQWRFETGGQVESSPTVADGTVFIGSTDENVYALDAETGDEQWRFDTDEAVYSSPTVVDGFVYVGVGIGWKVDTHVYALNAATGEEKWRFDTGGYVMSSPTVKEGRVFFGSTAEMGRVIALDADTGEERWQFENEMIVESSPTVVDNSVYIGGGTNVYALEADSGNHRWRFETSGLVRSSPTVADGTVFVGSHDENVYALDAETGDEQWRFGVGGHVLSSPTVMDQSVFVGGGGDLFDDTSVYAINADSGTKVWQFNTDGPVISSPTVADDTVFIGSTDRNVYALDAMTGDERWRFETGSGVGSSPTVLDGTVFVGSHDENVYALDGGVTRSSEGSRVRLGTLGHHDQTAGTLESGIKSHIGSPTTVDEFPYIHRQELIFEELGNDGEGIEGNGIQLFVDRNPTGDGEVQLTIGVENPEDSLVKEMYGYGSSQILVLYDTEDVTINTDEVVSRVDGGTPQGVVIANAISSLTSFGAAGSVPELVKEAIRQLAETVGDEWVTSQVGFETPASFERVEDVDVIKIDFSTDTIPAATSPTIIEEYELQIPVTVESGIEESQIAVVADMRGRTHALPNPQPITAAQPVSIEYRKQVTVPIPSDLPSVSEGIHSDSAKESEDDTTSEAMPGFGIATAVTAVGAAGYVLKRRLSDAPERSE